MKNIITFGLFIFSMLFFTKSISAAIPIVSEPSTTIVAPIETIEKPKTKNKKHPSINGILSFAFGLASYLIFPGFGIPAVIFGAISLTKKEPKNGYAIAGLILGGIGILILLVVTGLLIAGLI